MSFLTAIYQHTFWSINYDWDLHYRVGLKLNVTYSNIGSTMFFFRPSDKFRTVHIVRTECWIILGTTPGWAKFKTENTKIGLARSTNQYPSRMPHFPTQCRFLHVYIDTVATFPVWPWKFEGSRWHVKCRMCKWIRNNNIKLAHADDALSDWTTWSCSCTTLAAILTGPTGVHVIMTGVRANALDVQE